MAVITAQLLNAGAFFQRNPHIAVDLWGYGWFDQHDPSPIARLTSDPVQALVMPQLPVSNGAARPILGQPALHFGVDFYDTIHVSTNRLELGNVVTTQSLPVYVWNAYLEPKNLSAITGLVEGLVLSGQPEPPLEYPGNGSREYLLAVETYGAPVIDNTLNWVFDDVAVEPVSVPLLVMGRRIIAWSWAPDWSEGMRERLSWLTDMLQSESMVEQRRALRTAPRREFEISGYAEGRERQLLDIALFGWSQRTWAIPIWPDIQWLNTPVTLGSLRIDCQTSDLDFAVGSLAMLRGESAFDYEVVEVAAIDSSGLTLARATQSGWPRGTRLYPARMAQLVEQPSLTRLTDRLIQMEVRFLITEPCDWPKGLPTTLYRNRPVLEARPDESEDLSSSYQRNLLTLDSRMALPAVLDTAGLAMPVQGYRWLELGRVARSRYRQLLYALIGRVGELWVPTHADDLTLATQITEGGTTLEVENIGYARFGLQRTGRKDIRIELYDGTVFHRRITDSTEVSGDLERLEINAALGRLVRPSDVARISWMTLCRLDSDSVEIDHLTDSEGVAASSLVFRGVRDDDFV